MKAEIISKEQASSGFLKVEKLNLSVPDLKTGESFSQVRELVVQNDSVFILPYDKATGDVVVVAQHRPGAIYDDTTLVYETIAGRVDKNLSLEDIVIAEASEEAGLVVEKSQIEKLGEFYLSPGGSSEKAHVYLVPHDLSQVPSDEVYGLASEGENILMKKLQISEALTLSSQGCKTSIVLQMSLMAAKTRMH